MKKAVFILVCIFLINSINCFSQSVKKSKKEFKSDTKYVYGYSSDFNDALSMGITVGKVISSIDTSYYIKFHLRAPSSQYRTEICFHKASTVTFLAESGKFVDLKLTDVISVVQSDNQPGNLFIQNQVVYYSTTLTLEVTKKELINISSEPFYKILLPYSNCSSNVYKNIEFTKPAVFTRSNFIQNNINYILNI